jgi:hypothetical protein
MYHGDIPEKQWGPQYEYDLRDALEEYKKTKKDDPER